MPVYIIRAGEDGPVKIGFTDDIRRRFSKMQSDNHERLYILRLMEGDMRDEGAFQRGFAQFRIHGDWFSFSGDMLIASIPGRSDLPLRLPAESSGGDTDNFHANLIRDLGGKAKLAEALGLDRDVLTKWHVRGIPSKYWHRVIELGADAEPALVFTAADLERTKPETTRHEAAA